MNPGKQQIMDVSNGQIQINIKKSKWNGSFSFIYARDVYEGCYSVPRIVINCAKYSREETEQVGKCYARGTFGAGTGGTDRTAYAKAQRQETAMLPGEMETGSESWMESASALRPSKRQGQRGKWGPDHSWLHEQPEKIILYPKGNGKSIWLWMKDELGER